MKTTFVERLRDLVQRSEEIGALLSDPETIADQPRFRALSREYAQLETVGALVREYDRAEADRAAAEEMLADPDPAIRRLGHDELEAAAARHAELEARLKAHLVPRDPRDAGGVFLEIRAGTGGDEAALFAGDLFRMYLKYAERQGWNLEVLNTQEGEHGGFKEIVSRISGPGAYSRLKFESGAHRVQRVPETESQGRIHTSACTVAVLAEQAALAEFELNPAELRVDTYRASGAGGQHVNKTDSAVRITHLPTGVVVECQDERSQHKNRARAMALLKARLADAEERRRQDERAAERRILVGTGDRSERIRTYNFPQGRVTDHRINLTLYKLDDVLAGDLDPVIDPLATEHQAAQLAALEAREAH